MNINQALSRAKALSKKGDFDSAREIYLRILQKYPKNQEARRRLSNLGSPGCGRPGAQPPAQKINELVALYNDGQHNLVADSTRSLLNRFPCSAVLWNLSGAANFARGLLEEAENDFRESLKLVPDSPDAHNNLGNVLLQRNKPGDAASAYRRALQIKPDYVEAHYNLGKALKQSGDRNSAIEAYGDALRINPRFGEAHFNLANALSECNRTEEAIAHYRQVLSLNSAHAPAHFRLGDACRSLGQFQQAAEHYRQALKINPDFAEASNNLGYVLQRCGRAEDALSRFDHALRAKPDFADAFYNRANTCVELGRLGEACEAYRQALRFDPEFVDAYYNLGNVLKEQGEYRSAADSYRHALRLSPDYAEAVNNLGSVLHHMEELDEATKLYRKAIMLSPELAVAHYNLGNALKDKGDRDQALGCYERAAELAPAFAEAHYNLSKLKQYSGLDPQFEAMLKLYDNAPLDDENRSFLCFALAKAFEDTGNLEQSYRYLNEGNAARKLSIQYRIEFDRRLFARIRELQARIPFPSTGQTEPAITPIFILGMPRSGTTLIEQILSSHSMVTGGGELPWLEDLAKPLFLQNRQPDESFILDLREQYLERIGKISQGKPFITDKMPQNFRWIGLIASALPEAIILHIRRNPAAVCWSNFKHRFTDTGIGFAYDLNDTIEYFHLYRALMDFWQSLFGDRIYTVDYELLTENQEQETKKLVASSGLDWEEDCLNFHTSSRLVKTASALQVRKKMYKGSSEEWKKFSPFLNGMLDHLERN